MLDIAWEGGIGWAKSAGRRCCVLLSTFSPSPLQRAARILVAKSVGRRVEMAGGQQVSDKSPTIVISTSNHALPLVVALKWVESVGALEAPSAWLTLLLL